MDLIHRPNKTITQFLSLSHTVGVHLKNFFCREDSRLTPRNNQPDESRLRQMEPFPHAHTCQSYFRSGRTARPTYAGSDVASHAAPEVFLEKLFDTPLLAAFLRPVCKRFGHRLKYPHEPSRNRMRPVVFVPVVFESDAFIPFLQGLK